MEGQHPLGRFSLLLQYQGNTFIASLTSVPLNVSRRWQDSTGSIDEVKCPKEHSHLEFYLTNGNVHFSLKLSLLDQNSLAD